MEWKETEKRLKDGKTIDNFIQKSVNIEKEKWRSILKIIIDVIHFCAKNNLALRCTSDTIGDANSGIFFNTVELISHYNDRLSEHIENIKSKKGSLSYFSSIIQNEIIGLIGKRVRNKILTQIKQAKYFSILFYCTTDTSHKEQLSEIIRYVRIIDNKYYIMESFVDSIESKEKTGPGLASEITKKLINDGLNIENCRGQGFDNGANMAGKYNGVQSKICQINELARCVPCAAHSINLIRFHAANVTHPMVTFFGVVQQIVV